MTKTGYCWTCRHCEDSKKVVKTEGGPRTVASCHAPLTKVIWEDFRAPTWQQCGKARPPMIPDAPQVAPGTGIKSKWPVAFLPDLVLGCKHYVIKEEVRILIERLKNDQ